LSFGQLKKSWALIAIFFLIMLTGCAAPLKAVYNPATPSQVKTEGHPAILVEPFTDGRILPKGADARTIGRITAVVFDLRSPRLTLSEEPSAFATAAFASELKDAGFTVRAPGDAQASVEYVLTGEVKDFRLDIVERDTVSIEIVLRLERADTHAAVWSGTASVKDSRFAGVMGNTRATIAAYLESSLSGAIRGALPSMISATAAGRTGPATAEPPQKPIVNGRLIVTTSPPGAKVYIKGVYQGLTPVTLEREPGVYEVVIKMKGFREIKEEVSIRANETTELPEDLEKE
jgi:PEGA domain-containing protein